MSDLDAQRLDWPVMTLPDIEAILCAPGAPFEMEAVVVNGVATRAWKNAPPSLIALLNAARAYGDQVFCVLDDERVTYDGFYRATATLAKYLSDQGIAPGDRVALAMRNLPEWPVVLFAAAACGAIVVPLNAWWTGLELDYALRDCGARMLVCDAQRLERVAPHLPHLPNLTAIITTRSSGRSTDENLSLQSLIGPANGWGELAEFAMPDLPIDPDDAVAIFYTSGTTGHPKGALMSHRNLMTNIMSSAYGAARTVMRRGEALPESAPRTSLLVIPLFHVTACSAVLMGSIASGSAIILMHKWDTIRAFELIEQERINSTGGVPTIAWQLIEHPDRANYDLSSLDTIAYGGAPSAPELVRRIASDLKSQPGNGWGMTETTATVTGHSAEDYLNRPTSCGPPVPVSDLKIMDEAGEVELAVGERGELWVRGPQIVLGYWNNPEATAATFIDGWVRTGDIAYLDDEGFCFIADRAKDVIIRGGENIYSSEVENILYDHPAVTDAALIGLPHRTLGEEPAAVIHLAPGMSASEAELQAWVRERLAAFKTPVRIVFCDETLPRNANGKIMKRELKPLFD
ncbi:MAG: class I adenylate-forming enzyme family protein [Sphingopyxis sp.]